MNNSFPEAFIDVLELVRLHYRITRNFEIASGLFIISRKASVGFGTMDQVLLALIFFFQNRVASS